MQSVESRFRSVPRPCPARRCGAVLAVLALVALARPAGAQRAPSFQGLGDLPGGEFQSLGVAVSADGSTVVGNSRSAFGDEAFRWTRAGGMQPLGALEKGNGMFNSAAYGVSADGSVVVGSSARGGGLPPDTRAFRWTAATGMQSLGVLGPTDANSGSVAFDVGPDGTVVVGQSASSVVARPFRWTAADGMRPLVEDPNPPRFADARAVSGDGSTVVGAYGNRPFRWTRAGGMELLSHPGLQEGLSPATDVSADGSVVVGMVPVAFGRNEGEYYYQAFRWTRGTGTELLPKGHAGSIFPSDGAYGVSGDGSLVVGASANDAVVWTAAGPRLLEDVLTRDYGLDLGGWQLDVALDVSADGSTITGRGHNPAGQTEGWVAVLPEPSGLGLAALAGGLALRRRRDDWSPRRANRRS